MYKFNLKIMLFCFISFTFLITSCDNSISNNEIVEEIYTYNVSIKDNVIFFIDDTIEFHQDSFKIENESQSGVIDHIDFDPSFITSFDTSTVGESQIEFIIDSVKVNKKINIVPKDIIYTSTTSGITITNFNNITTNMVVPRTVDGIIVTKLGFPSFYDNQTIRSVSLPEGLIEIEGTFEGSTLETVNIPETLTTLSRGCFARTNLKSLELNGKLDSIPMGSFQSCNIDSLVVPSNIKTIGASAFSECKIKEITLEEGLEIIEAGAFSNNKIRNIVLPKGIKYIGESAFFRNDFESISILDEIPTISDDAFLLKDNDIQLFIHTKYNSIPELERIFGSEPLTINSIPKTKIYTLEEVDSFKTWASEKKIELKLINTSNYWSDVIQSTQYKLGLYIKTGYTLSNYTNYIITKDGEIFKYTHTSNDNDPIIDTNLSLTDLLEDK